MSARNRLTINMLKATMATITSTSVTDTGAVFWAVPGVVEAPPSCRFVFVVGKSAVSRTASEPGAATGVEVWGPTIEVRVDGESEESEGDELEEGCGPIKKVCVEAGNGDPESVELEDDRLLDVPETAGAAVEAAEAVEAEVCGAPDAAKLSSLVAIQLDADPTSSPFT
jgi:hypothetical protein